MIPPTFDDIEKAHASGEAEDIEAFLAKFGESK